MKTLRLLFILSLLTALMVPATAMGKTLSGERYGFAILGAKDYDHYRDPSVSIKLGANLPINNDLDITPFLIHESLDSDSDVITGTSIDRTTITLAARGDYFLKKKKKLAIYVGGGAGLALTETTVPGSPKQDDTDLYFQAHGGLDMNMGPDMGLRPECAYLRVGDNDDVHCGAMFNIQLGNSFNLLAEARFFIDNRELFYAIGGGMSF